MDSMGLEFKVAYNINNGLDLLNGVDKFGLGDIAFRRYSMLSRVKGRYDWGAVFVKVFYENRTNSIYRFNHQDVISLRVLREAIGYNLSRKAHPFFELDLPNKRFEVGVKGYLDTYIQLLTNSSRYGYCIDAFIKVFYNC